MIGISAEPFTLLDGEGIFREVIVCVCLCVCVRH